MGGAILISLINRYKDLPIDGVILIAPAIWNFTETNFLKSIPLRAFSKIFPNLDKLFCAKRLFLLTCFSGVPKVNNILFSKHLENRILIKL